MQPLIALVALPLLLFLPGFVTLHSLPLEFLKRSKNHNRTAGDNADFKSPDLIEGIGLAVSASLLLSSVAAFILVLLGMFSLWILLLVIGLYVVLVIPVTHSWDSF